MGIVGTVAYTAGTGASAKPTQLTVIDAANKLSSYPQPQCISYKMGATAAAAVGTPAYSSPAAALDWEYPSGNNIWCLKGANCPGGCDATVAESYGPCGGVCVNCLQVVNAREEATDGACYLSNGGFYRCMSDAFYANQGAAMPAFLHAYTKVKDINNAAGCPVGLPVPGRSDPIRSDPIR